MPDVLVDAAGVSLEYHVDPKDMSLGGLIFPGGTGCWYHHWSASMRGGLAIVIMGTTKKNRSDLEREVEIMDSDDNALPTMRGMYNSLKDKVRAMTPKRNLPLLAMANIPYRNPSNHIHINEVSKSDPGELIIRLNYYVTTLPTIDNPRLYLVRDPSSDQDFIDIILSRTKMFSKKVKELKLLDSCFNPPWYLTADPERNRLYFSKFSSDKP